MLTLYRAHRQSAGGYRGYDRFEQQYRYPFSARDQGNNLYGDYYGYDGGFDAEYDGDYYYDGDYADEYYDGEYDDDDYYGGDYYGYNGQYYYSDA